MIYGEVLITWRKKGPPFGGPPFLRVVLSPFSLCRFGISFLGLLHLVPHVRAVFGWLAADKNADSEQRCQNSGDLAH